MNTETEMLADRYQLGDIIGKGGMGEVRRAHDTRLGRDVAIKFLRPDLAAQEAVRLRFEDEARNAGQLTHPNVVTVYDSGEHNGQPYIVMECLPGRSLRDEIAKGPLPESFATVVALDALGGLEAAHAAGIVHRDVAPSNILLTDDGRAKIADFGIAKAGEGLNTTMAGQIVGTPAYLSPARLQGAPALPADDIYALGVTLYEAVTGARLFSGPTPLAVAQTILDEPPPRLREARADLSPGFAAAVDGAMARDASARITTAAAMRAAIEHDAGEQTTLVGVVDADPAAATTTMPAAAGPATAVASAAVPASAVAATSWRAFAARAPREVWAAVGAIVLIGALVLVLANRDVSDPGTANTTATSTVAESPTVPTTITPIPTTEVPVVPAVNLNVGNRDDDDDNGRGKGKGKDD
ncbi:MAG: serine/threonine-protein kinase [Acidimicrobiales bacterium]|nr:serine/threonine-protein kinase [Acidimicrobiales bacterium]